MKIKKIFDDIPEQKKINDDRLKDLSRILKIQDSRKIPSDLTVERLREIANYVTNSDINFEDLQVFILKVLRVPSLMGDIGYI